MLLLVLSTRIPEAITDCPVMPGAVALGRVLWNVLWHDESHLHQSFVIISCRLTIQLK